MSPPVVVVVVAAEPTGDRAIYDIAGATAEGMPAGTRVDVAREAGASADVVVVVRWADESRRRAVVDVRTRDGRASVRELAFEASDPESERNRAVGYAIVSMIPADVRGVEGVVVPAAIEPPRPPPEPPPPPPAEPVSLRDRLWIDAAAAGVVGGGATSLGGNLAVSLPVGRFAFRAGAGARAGEIARANASSLALRVGVGAGYWTVALDPRLLVGARAGLVLLRHSARRDEPAGGSTSDAHVLLGSEAFGEAGWIFSRGLALVAAIGVEVAFGTTTVYVGPSNVQSIPPLRLAGEFGLRLAF